MIRQCVAAGLLAAFVYPAFAQDANASRDFAWTAVRVEASADSPRGYVEFQKFCAVCHGKGSGKPGTLALAAKYGDTKPALLEERTDLDAESIRHFVRHGVSVMPLIRKTELSDADLDAIIAYLTRPRP